MRVPGSIVVLFLLVLEAAPVDAANGPRWRFEASLRTLDEIQVRACSDVAAARVRFTTGDAAASASLIDATRSGAGDVRRDAGELVVDDWRAGECLSTRVNLRTAAQAQRHGFGFSSKRWRVVDPRRWLWRPRDIDPSSTLRFDLPRNWSASVPWPPVAGEPHTVRLGRGSPDWPARTAFGRFDIRRIERAGGVLEVALLPPWSGADIHRIEPVADAIVQAIGRLPRAHVQVLVAPIPGERRAAPWGEVMRGGASAVHLFVGADAPTDALISDWTATHEFSHLLHPYLGGSGRWLAEGLASYYQNVLRARSGALDADDAWERIDAGFARGRADTRSAGASLRDASRGIDRTRAYMRVYWSGAAFWLESDLALRAQGDSLDEVLARYADCCLEAAGPTDPEAFMATLDRWSGRDDFSARYRRYAALTAFPAIAIPPAADPRGAAIMHPRPRAP